MSHLFQQVMHQLNQIKNSLNINYGFHSFRLLTDFVCLYNYEF
jgi:hypothetical protein